MMASASEYEEVVRQFYEVYRIHCSESRMSITPDEAKGVFKALAHPQPECYKFFKSRRILYAAVLFIRVPVDTHDKVVSKRTPEFRMEIVQHSRNAREIPSAEINFFLPFSKGDL